MSEKCGRCEKTVYPTEKLKCLDKTWHKGCFKCKECGMTLNMKNYKGYNKEPYCSAHYPTTKFTAVADTPESQRLSKNTKQQSQVKYQEEFNKDKGKMFSSAGLDDPTLQRALEQQRNISQIYYQEEFRKNKGHHIPVGVDDPSIRLATSVQQQISQVQYHAEFEKQKGRKIEVTDDPELVRHKANTAIMSNVSYHGVLENRGEQEKRRATLDYGEAGQPLTEEPSAPQPVSQPIPQPTVQQDPRSGSSGVGGGGGGGGGVQTNGGVAPVGVTSGGPPSLPRPEGRVYKAIYDYQAQDDDEIGFEEGDLIINCEPIDEGWMQGMHKKSGQVGMLPANYVELVL